MASRTKLTPEITDKLCRAIRMGITNEDAASMANIGRSTFYRWKQRGKAAKSGAYRDFWDHIKRAEVECKAILLKRVHDAASGNQEIVETREVVRDGGVVEVITTTKRLPPAWQAAAWILERKFPDEFGRNRQPAEDKHSSIDDVIVILENARVEAGIQDKPVDPSPSKE
jgi:transposase